MASSANAELRTNDFAPALEKLKHIKDESGELLSRPFLDVCRCALPVVEKFGSSMALVKSDIGGNIVRLDTKYESDPTAYNVIYNIVRKEIELKTSKQSSSCTNGLLWLTRAMDFLVALFQNLLTHPEWTMSQAANDAYVKTLKKWHGWIAGAAFTVAIKLVPDRKTFFDNLAGANLNEDMAKFVEGFSPILVENHKFLQSVGMDELRAS